jgi:anti-anti-sigma factor
MAFFTVQKNGPKSVVLLEGDLTITQVNDLRAAVTGEIGAGANEVVFDIARTRLLDSSGIGLLIAAGNTMAKKSGIVRVINAAPELVRLFQSMRLVSRLNVSQRA